VELTIQNPESYKSEENPSKLIIQLKI